jgi:hypothetical protein
MLKLESKTISLTINQLHKQGKLKDERIRNQLMSFIEERHKEIDCKNVIFAYNLIKKNSFDLDSRKLNIDRVVPYILEYFKG